MRHEPTRRALETVSLLATAREPVSTSSAARTLGASRATVHAVLTELHTSRWAEKAGTGWIAGPTLRALGRAVGREPDLTRIARPALLALSERTGMTAATLRLGEDVIEVVDVVRGEVRTSSPPVMTTGHTVALRAPFAREVAVLLPPSRGEQWLADGAPSEAARERLEVVLPQVARRGWSVDRLTPARRELLRMADALEKAGIGPLVRDRVSELFTELGAIDVLDSELTDGADLAVFSVSAPVLGVAGPPLGSIAVTPGRRMTGRAVRRTVAAVTETAAEVSELLRSTP